MKHLKDMTEVEIRSYLQRLGELLEEVLPAGPGRNGRALFCLLIFDDPGVGQYLSNAQRPDIIKALREAADRLEKKEDIPR